MLTPLYLSLIVFAGHKRSINLLGIHSQRWRKYRLKHPTYIGFEFRTFGSNHQNFLSVIEYLNGSLQVSLDARWWLVGDFQAGLRQGGRELGVGFGGQPVGSKYLRLVQSSLATNDWNPIFVMKIFSLILHKGVGLVFENKNACFIFVSSWKRVFSRNTNTIQVLMRLWVVTIGNDPKRAA